VNQQGELVRVRQSYAGADWIASNYHVTPSAFGTAVANLLGDLFSGIYHIESPSLGEAQWGHDQYIRVCVYGELATYGFDLLTRLVVLCHDRHIRCAVQAAAPGYLRLCFMPREREGDISHRHPTLDQAARVIREEIG
jgi:hypothetical protein